MRLGGCGEGVLNFLKKNNLSVRLNEAFLCNE